MSARGDRSNACAPRFAAGAPALPAALLVNCWQQQHSQHDHHNSTSLPDHQQQHQQQQHSSLHAARQQQCGGSRQQQPHHPLQFVLVQQHGSRKRLCAVAPFARLSGSMLQLHQGDSSSSPHELFQLSRHTASASSLPLGALSDSDDPGSSGEYARGLGGIASSSEGGGRGGNSSGYESDSELSDDLAYSVLDKINCQFCKGPINRRPGGGRRHILLPWTWGRSRSSRRVSSGEFLVCDGCQCCFHVTCCKARGVSTRERKGVWFHGAACHECQRRLQQQAAAGATPLPDGRSWELVDLAPVQVAAPGAQQQQAAAAGQQGLAALRTLKAHLSDVLEVLLPLYGPGAARQLVDTTKGYAVLLRQASQPVTAGLLDVYGTDVAVLDLVATVMEEQGKGHCRALLGAVEGFLGPQLGVRALLAVCPADEPRMVELWQSRYGFRRLPAKDLRELQAALPPLGFYSESDALLLTKPLSTKPAKTRKKEAQEQAAAAAEGAAGDGAAAEGTQQEA